MKKSNAVVAIAIVLVLLGSLVLFSMMSDYVSPNCNLNDYSVGSSKWSKCLSLQTENRMNEHQSEEDCEKEKYSFSKDTCYRDVAINNNDPSLCEKIDTTFGDDDLIYCYAKVSMENNNVDACNKAAELVDDDFYGFGPNDCFLAIASNNMDSSLCEKIKSPSSKALCFDVVAGKVPPIIY